jgi:hypothetical protein
MENSDPTHSVSWTINDGTLPWTPKRRDLSEYVYRIQDHPPVEGDLPGLLEIDHAREPTVIRDAAGATARRNSQYGFEKTGAWAAAEASGSRTAVAFTAPGSENTTLCARAVPVVSAE